MKTKPIRLFSILAALALCTGCVGDVTSRTPVGTGVPALQSKVWNGIWRTDDGGVVKTKIKDVRLGIVQITTKAAWLKPGVTDDLSVRTLGPETIGNVDIAGVYSFSRVSADGGHLLCFPANEAVFESLIKQHEIVGKIEKDKDGKPTGNCTIEGFSERDYARLGKEGFDLRSLFDEDPSTVLIRYRWIPLW